MCLHTNNYYSLVSTYLQDPASLPISARPIKAGWQSYTTKAYILGQRNKGKTEIYLLWLYTLLATECCIYTPSHCSPRNQCLRIGPVKSL